jgi:hypothetical protein
VRRTLFGQLLRSRICGSIAAEPAKSPDGPVLALKRVFNLMNWQFFHALIV